MLKKVTFIFALFLLGQAHAAHYGMAGCGLGAMVWKDEPGKIQILAATVNNIVSPQTSAISSGTSGCFEDSGAMAQLNYIETNKEALKIEAARGNGETLQGLSTLMGCQDAGAFNSEVKANYQSIFSNENSQGILNTIKSNPAVQKTCGTLG